MKSFSFLMELFQRSSCPAAILEMGSSTWDLYSVILMTLREALENKHLAELEKVAWYRDAF
jgi:hypothetical protein